MFKDLKYKIGGRFILCLTSKTDDFSHQIQKT